MGAQGAGSCRAFEGIRGVTPRRSGEPAVANRPAGVRWCRAPCRLPPLPLGRYPPAMCRPLERFRRSHSGESLAQAPESGPATSSWASMGATASERLARHSSLHPGDPAAPPAGRAAGPRRAGRFPDTRPGEATQRRPQVGRATAGAPVHHVADEAGARVGAEHSGGGVGREPGTGQSRADQSSGGGFRARWFCTGRFCAGRSFRRRPECAHHRVTAR
jgi:hypothetical protein